MPNVVAAVARTLAEVRGPLAAYLYPDVSRTSKQRLWVAASHLVVFRVYDLEQMGVTLVCLAPFGKSGSSRSKLHIHWSLHLET